MKKYYLIFLVGFLAMAGLVFFLARIPLAPTQTPKKISLVTSFYPLYYFASQLVGDDASVNNITPAGSEPHDYEPTPREIATIQSSQLLILNGGGFEPWAASIEGGSTQIVNTGEGLTNTQVVKDGRKKADPHVWLSPKLAKRQAQKIMESLIRLDPDHEKEYQARGQTLMSRFDELDHKYTLGLGQCLRRDFVTSHSAFSYLAGDYNLNQVAISGLSPEEEPSLKQIAQIADFAKRQSIQYIFFETLVSPKLSETVAREIGVKTLVLNPIEGLSVEDMKAGKNYFTIMEDNLANLQTALSCK